MTKEHVETWQRAEGNHKLVPIVSCCLNMDMFVGVSIHSRESTTELESFTILPPPLQ